MGRDYAVRASLHYTAKGKCMKFAIGDAEITKFKDSYYKLWGKGDRLYFLTANPSNGGVKLCERGLSVSSQAVIEAIEKFEGEYDKLHHDTVTGYYYIDLADMHEMSLVLPSNAGLKHNYPSTKKERKRDTMKFSKDIEKPQEPVKCYEVKFYEDKLRDDITNPVSKKENIECESSINSVLTSMIVEYTLNGKSEKAAAIAEAMKRLNLVK